MRSLSFFYFENLLIMMKTHLHEDGGCVVGESRFFRRFARAILPVGVFEYLRREVLFYLKSF
jgi:hypothetical protein